MAHVYVRKLHSNHGHTHTSPTLINAKGGEATLKGFSHGEKILHSRMRARQAIIIIRALLHPKYLFVVVLLKTVHWGGRGGGGKVSIIAQNI